ncbi:hypothetical protein M404DRAFT_1001436 [Pisolithus tinctorius Marx 270]|uniref:Secreted protein n=1 Tax=Pisolithus tinctorius Marx 270 TaxID=870435 RepID=A0A0C3NRL3_PISTI|nr:hypothetical protein M404DRAFT_1001436 [Pisolithus tinctorius Marx 270]
MLFLLSLTLFLKSVPAFVGSLDCESLGADSQLCTAVNPKRTFETEIPPHPTGVMKTVAAITP